MIVVLTRSTSYAKAGKKTWLKKTDALNTRRNIIIGETVSMFFPEVFRFQPRKTVAENAAEFAPLINFLSALAADREYVIQLKRKTGLNAFAPDRPPS